MMAFAFFESCLGFPFLAGALYSSFSSSSEYAECRLLMALRKYSAGIGTQPFAHALSAISLSDDTTIHCFFSDVMMRVMTESALSPILV
jgi:hypothetical protein